MFFVYFAVSLSNDKVYIGFTSKDPVVRIQEHNSGYSAFTRNSGPYELIYYESYICKKDALRREKFYKSGVGREIKKLIVAHFRAHSSDG